jgi:hypothetical protein
MCGENDHKRDCEIDGERCYRGCAATVDWLNWHGERFKLIDGGSDFGKDRDNLPIKVTL